MLYDWYNRYDERERREGAGAILGQEGSRNVSSGSARERIVTPRLCSQRPYLSISLEPKELTFTPVPLFTRRTPRLPARQIVYAPPPKAPRSGLTRSLLRRKIRAALKLARFEGRTKSCHVKPSYPVHWRPRLVKSRMYCKTWRGQLRIALGNLLQS